MKTHKSAWIAVTSVALAMALCNGASASPPSHRQLGARFKVLSTGQTVTVEIRLEPRRSFDSVRVEAGSGVGSLSPPCSFNDVVRGGSYVCRVNVTHAADYAALTLNVVGEIQAEPGKPDVFEVSHFTIANPDYVRPTRKSSGRPTPGLEVLPGQNAPKRP